MAIDWLDMRPTESPRSPEAKRRSSRRRRLALLIAVFLVAGGLIWWRATVPNYGPGDPGGRILTQLKTSTVAVPSSATIGYQHFIEPHMDSCDGMAGTQGWDPPAVQVYFHWTGTPAALLSYTSSHLARAGWGAMTPETDNGVAGGHWSKVIDNGSVAYAGGC